ncbi:MAG: GNAT family N-acetyltransferase [Thermoplasmatota archaeon]|jgi:predicted GNAT family N-acyltransferase
MVELKIKIVKSKNEFNEILNIRETVFIKEQNVPKEIEMDDFDKESELFIVYLKNKPIGCARIRKINDYAKLERIAILKEYRGKGYGKALTNFLIGYCKKKGFKKIKLHSQVYVANFYKKLGFKTIGKKFLEADIEHIQMIKTI